VIQRIFQKHSHFFNVATHSNVHNC
jgi:hypothetical protein